MNSTSDLLFEATKRLRDSTIKLNKPDKPLKPFCLLYLGDSAASYHKELAADIEQGWGSFVASEMLCYRTCDSVELSLLSYGSNEPADPERISSEIRQASRADGAFLKRDSVELFAVIDSTDIGSPAGLQQWYQAVEEIKNAHFAHISTTTTLIILLHEYGQARNAAAEVIKDLLQLYRDSKKAEVNKHVFDTVFLFADTGMTGAPTELLSAGESGSDFNLLADVIFLMNSAGCLSAASELRSGDVPAFTASYGAVTKPLHDIALITLKTILCQVLELDYKQQEITKILSAAIGTENGTLQIQKDFIGELKKKLPMRDFINYLPGDISDDISYQQADDQSFGVLSEFFKEHYEKVIKAQHDELSPQIVSHVVDMISSKVAAKSLHEDLSEQMIDAVMDGIQKTEGGIERKSVLTVVNAKVENIVGIYIDADIRAAIAQANESAKVCWAAWSRLVTEVSYKDVADESVRSYYEQLAKSNISSHELDELRVRLFTLTNTYEDILDLLLSALEKCFESHGDYKLSYFAELAKRTETTDPNRLSNQISKELTAKNAKENILFYTMYSFNDACLEVFFMDEDGEEADTTAVIKKELTARSANGVPQEFVNANRSDKVESIMFYECTESTLEAGIE